MVSSRCKTAVKDELQKLGQHCVVIDLGEVEIMGTPTESELEEIRIALHRIGLELIDDKKSILIEKIKNVIIDLVHNKEEPIKMTFSNYLSEQLHHDYGYMANLFSEVQGITIAQCMIMHKIERIKELIIYDELNISEIAWKLNYSSVAHLSGQFKKATGLTPTHFKQLKQKRRTPIEDIGEKAHTLELNTSS